MSGLPRGQQKEDRKRHAKTARFSALRPPPRQPGIQIVRRPYATIPLIKGVWPCRGTTGPPRDFSLLGHQVDLRSTARSHASGVALSRQGTRHEKG